MADDRTMSIDFPLDGPETEAAALPFTPVPAPAGPGNSADTGDDWPRQATRTIVRTVDSVRDKTTGPAITAAAATVYGLVAVMALAVLTTALLIAVVRGLEIILWHKVWLAYLVLAAVFLAGGLVSWSRRQPLPG
jgi:hypothetical protein